MIKLVHADGDLPPAPERCCPRSWLRTTADGTRQRCRRCGAYAPLPTPAEVHQGIARRANAIARARSSALLWALCMPLGSTVSVSEPLPRPRRR